MGTAVPANYRYYRSVMHVTVRLCKEMQRKNERMWLYFDDDDDDDRHRNQKVKHNLSQTRYQKFFASIVMPLPD